MQIHSDSSSQRPHPSIEKKPSSTKGKARASEKRHTKIEELDAAIGQMSRAINAASYELILLIREFDERAGWLKWGYDSALPWLKWRCDLSTNAARDKLRMAHALKELPLLSDAFSKGELSYTKIRALTRIATPANEAELIDMAMRMSARHVEEHCKQRHNVSKASTAIAVKAQQNRTFRVWPDQARGTVNFSIELPAEEAELLQKAVEKAAVKLSAETGSASSPSEEPASWAQQQADAMVLVCRSFLDDTKQRGTKRAEKNRVAPPIARMGLPQIRTCAISASGSSEQRFATGYIEERPLGNTAGARGYLSSSRRKRTHVSFLEERLRSQKHHTL